MAQILLVDDDAGLLDVLSMACTDAGYAVLTAHDGLGALAAIKTHQPDLLVSDVNMRGMDGFSLVRKLRAAGDQTPVILLTARNHEIDEALGLEMGADDYVTKPFNTRLLLARIAALLRRDQLRRQPAVAAVQAHGVAIDADRLEVRLGATVVPMTVSEFKLVEALTKRPGHVLNRDRLLELVRGDDSVVVDRIIDTYVRRVRRKFEAVDPAFDRIDTVVGVGYRWKPDA